MYSRVSIDFETRSAIDLRTAGADVYAKHPTTDIMCLAYAFDDSPVEIWTPSKRLPEKLMDAVANGVHVYAWNASFELLIWEHIFYERYGADWLDPKQTYCSMAMAYAMALPGSLEKAAAAVGLETQKDMKGRRVMLQLSQPREILDDATPIFYTPKDAPEKFEHLYRYCINDVEVERQLAKRLMPLSKYEREVWLLDYKINRRGIFLDRHSVNAAIRIVNTEKERHDKLMRKITGDSVATCTAVGQLGDWLRVRGIETKSVDKASVIALLERTDLPNDVRHALLLRQEAAKSSTAKFEAMSKSVCEDGRVRGTLQYHGAGTGRWAGRRLQVHNLPRSKISAADIEFVFDVLRRTE